MDEESLAKLASLSEYLLTRLQTSVNDAGADLLVLTFGPGYRLADHQWIEDAIIESCRKHEIEFLNIDAAMRTDDWRIYYGPNGHFFPAGHRKVAELIVDSPALQRLQ